MKEKRSIRKVDPLKRWTVPEEKPLLLARGKSPRRWRFGCGGAFTGGCLIPILLLWIAAASGDRGGPFFWWIIWLPLSGIGLVAGLAIHDIRRIGKNDDS